MPLTLNTPYKPRLYNISPIVDILSRIGQELGCQQVSYPPLIIRYDNGKLADL